jgi:hypothetical protein
MLILVDTNILARLLEREHVDRPQCNAKRSLTS